MNFIDTLLKPLHNADRHDVAGVVVEVVRSGSGRVKRTIYPPGFRWSTNMKPLVGTDLCMHAHVGFLARGQIHVRYGDGCALEMTAPHVVSIEPGHDAWVVGEEPAVLIEFDFERETVRLLGMPEIHGHGDEHERKQ